jgi:hypothetical protein
LKQWISWAQNWQKERYWVIVSLDGGRRLLTIVFPSSYHHDGRYKFPVLPLTVAFPNLNEVPITDGPYSKGMPELKFWEL